MLVLLTFVGPLAGDMYLPAFPAMAVELGTDPAGVQLTLTAMMIGFALGQLLLGPLSDWYGRRTLLLAGASVAALSTALCALAPSLEWLAALRFAQGVSAAAGIVIGRAVVSDVAEGPAAERLQGVLMTLTGVAPIIAPLAGAALIEAGDWRLVFWALAAAMAVMAAGAARWVPETLPAGRRQRGSLLGAARQVLGDRVYVGYTLVFSFAFGALFCYIAASPFLYQRVLGLSLAQSSFTFAAGALIVTLSSAVNAVLVTRIAARRLLVCGLTGLTVSSGALLAVSVAGLLDRVSGLALITVAFVALGLVFSNAASLALARVSRAAGTGSAVLGALQNGMAAVVAPLVGLGGGDTAVPMAAGMTAIALLALAALSLTRAGQHEGYGSRASRTR